MAFEELEALRYLPYLKKEGLLITNRQRMLPMPVITGAASYPDDPVAEMKAKGARVIAADASAIGQEKGDARAANVVLLGILSRELDFPEELWIQAIEESMKPKLVEMNLRAFAAGRALV